jgi:hypothetical protein
MKPEDLRPANLDPEIFGPGLSEKCFSKNGPESPEIREFQMKPEDLLQAEA